MISLWENCVLLTRKVEKRISVDMRHVLAVFRLWGAPQGPLRVPNWWFPMDNLVCHEKSKNFLQWDDFTMGKLGLTCMKGEQRHIQWFEACFGHFQALRGPPKGPQGSPMVPNGQPSVPWKFEIKYFTMGWFHYGKTDWHFYSTSFHFKNFVLHPWNGRVSF